MRHANIRFANIAVAKNKYSIAFVKLLVHPY